MTSDVPGAPEPGPVGTPRPGSRWNDGRVLAVGARVMVRRHLRGDESSHLYTDVLGEVLSVDPLRVRAKDGTETTVPESDIAVLKVLPPRPVLVRDIRALGYAAALGWPGTEHEIVGGWLCRAGDRWSYRHGAAVPVEPWAVDTDLREVASWYADRGLEPWVELPSRLVAADQLLVDGARLTPDAAARLDAAGSGELEVRTAPLDPLAGLAARVPEDAGVELAEAPTDAFLSAYHGTAALPHAEAEPVLAAHTLGVRFAHLYIGSELAAIARGALSAAPGGTPVLGISCVETTPDFRRRGLAHVVVGALAEWAAAEGADIAHLHVFRRNAAGLALWADLGFAEHHRTRHVPLPAAPR